MSPIFEPDPTKVSATTPIYDAGEYELKITGGEPVCYARDDDPEDVVAGYRYYFEMVGKVMNDGSLETEGLEGKDVTPMRLYVHTEGAFRMAKRFLIPANGYPLTDDGELEANEEFFGDHDWFVDREDVLDEDSEVTAGDGWSACFGNHVRCNLTVDMYEGTRQQVHSNFRPVS